MHSSSGHFSTRSAYRMVSSSGVPDPSLKVLWRSGLPTRAALFTWRVLCSAVPVDEEIINCGIVMPSKCVCCTQSPAVETLEHLLIVGEMAQSMWAC